MSALIGHIAGPHAKRIAFVSKHMFVNTICFGGGKSCVFRIQVVCCLKKSCVFRRSCVFLKEVLCFLKKRCVLLAHVAYKTSYDKHVTFKQMRNLSENTQVFL